MKLLSKPLSSIKYLLLTLVCSSVFSLPLFSFAAPTVDITQTGTVDSSTFTPATPAAGSTAAPSVINTALDGGIAGVTGAINAFAPGLGVVTAAVKAVSPVGADANAGCGWSPSSWGTCILQGVGFGIMLIANFILGIAGVIFNYVMVKSVFQFGTVIGNSEGLLVAWGILRDIGNMMLLFGFIFMGLATILDLHSFPVKKTLPRLLIFAVLMNFSLFACEAIIDVSNALSTEMYNITNTSECVTSGTSIDPCLLNYGLAGHIMKSTGLSTVYSLTKDQGGVADAGIFLVLALFATIGAVVFIAASVMLIFRLVILTFLMVVSPIGFAGMAIPPLQRFANSWWNKLISESFFAPVMMLLMLVSLKITDAFNTGNIAQNGLAAAVISHQTDSLGIIMVYLVVICFLVASIIVAKNMGAAGASTAVKFAGSTVFGGMGYVGRRTAGAGFYNIGEKFRKSEYAQRNPNAARYISAGLDKGANSSFDPRATKSVQKLAKAQHLDLGKPGKAASHGFHGIEEAKTKARVDFEKKLKPTERQISNESSLKAQLKELQQKHDALVAKAIEEAEGKRREVEVARAKGEDPKELDRLADEYKSSLVELDKVKKDPEIDELRKKIKAADPSKVKSKTVAENLEHSGLPFSISRHANHKAAEKIKSGKASGIDGALAALKEEFTKSTQKDEHANDGHDDADTSHDAPKTTAAKAAGGGDHGGHH